MLNKIDLINDGSAGMIESSPLFNEFSVVKNLAVRGDGLTQLKNRIIQKTYSNDNLHARPQTERGRVPALRPVTPYRQGQIDRAQS